MHKDSTEDSPRESQPSQAAATPQPATPDSGAASSGPLKLRLSAMMFLQYFVQGSYLPIISVYVKESLGFSPQTIGFMGAALAVGPLAAPFVIGQLVDRRFSTQHVLAVCHLLGGAVMLSLYRMTDARWVLALGTLYSILYVPTMMLTNSLAFHHLRDRDREFPLIRLWGTIGFIVPAWLLEFALLRGLTGDALDARRGIALATAGLAGLAMGVYSWLLPQTPPAAPTPGQEKFTSRLVVRLLQRREILVLVTVSFFAAMVHKFYFVANGPFLTSLLRAGGVQGQWEGSISSLGQVAEIGVMAILASLILRIGFRGTISLGLLAYLIRCLLFVAADQASANFQLALAIAIAGQLLHGFCFGCFLAAAFMYFDRTTPADLRGTVQNVYGTFVLGLGFFAGGFFTGFVSEHFTDPATKVMNFTGIWLTAAALAAVCLGAFLLFFPKEGEPVADASPQPI